MKSISVNIYGSGFDEIESARDLDFRIGDSVCITMFYYSINLVSACKRSSTPLNQAMKFSMRIASSLLPFMSNHLGVSICSPSKMIKAANYIATIIPKW